jgi:hypothetical protein
MRTSVEDESVCSFAISTFRSFLLHVAPSQLLPLHVEPQHDRNFCSPNFFVRSRSSAVLRRTNFLTRRRAQFESQWIELALSKQFLWLNENPMGKMSFSSVSSCPSGAKDVIFRFYESLLNIRRKI